LADENVDWAAVNAAQKLYEHLPSRCQVEGRVHRVGFSGVRFRSGDAARHMKSPGKRGLESNARVVRCSFDGAPSTAWSPVEGILALRIDPQGEYARYGRLTFGGFVDGSNDNNLAVDECLIEVDDDGVGRRRNAPWLRSPISFHGAWLVRPAQSQRLRPIRGLLFRHQAGLRMNKVWR
jgi:hypothetical protein